MPVRKVRLRRNLRIPPSNRAPTHTEFQVTIRVKTTRRWITTTVYPLAKSADIAGWKAIEYMRPIDGSPAPEFVITHINPRN